MADLGYGPALVMATALALGSRIAAAQAWLPVHFVPNQYLFVCFFLVWLHPRLYAFVLRCAGFTAPPKAESKTNNAQGRLARITHLILAFVGCIVLAHAYPVSGSPPTTFWLLAGLTVQSLGVLMAFWARIYLAEFWRGTPAIREDHKLITTGPYRFVRHPIYTAVLLQCFGALLTAQSLYSLIGLLLVAAIYIFKLEIEEQMLASAFPAEHRAWCGHTWRLLPFVY
jgi:protein-S-isoprenylcysteine O-methyltransferase Ste14